MIVNMYVDHLMTTSPASAEEVWNATREHSKLFSDAASRIGMSPREYTEFRKALLDGKAVYVTLPKRVDAMSGARRGSVYAVKNAVMTTPQLGWRVDLADGNAVYIPQVCANLSFVRNGAVAHVIRKPRTVAVNRHKGPAYVQSISTEPGTPVSMVPPDAVAPPVPEAPATTAQAYAAPSGGGFPFFAFIPAAVGGIIAGATHGPSTPPPPCANGSNAIMACQK